MPNIIRPMQKQFKKNLTQQKHRYIPPKIQTKHRKIIIQHNNSLTYRKRKLTLHNNFNPFIKIIIVECYRYFFLLLTKYGEDLTY